MLDKFLAFGATFDWISPVAAWVQDFANGPSHTFLIPHACGYSGLEIQRLLQGKGVKTWGLMVVEDTLMVTVPLPQARWAAHLLQGAGVPFGGGVPGASPAPRRSPGQARSAKADPSSSLTAWVDGLADALDDLLGP